MRRIGRNDETFVCRDELIFRYRNVQIRNDLSTILITNKNVFELFSKVFEFREMG